MSENKMITEKSWEEFRKTGLLLIINQILHIFGWAIAVEYDNYDEETDSGSIVKVCPIRCKFRGFSEESVDRSYEKISRYMNDNAEELLKEVIEK